MIFVAVLCMNYFYFVCAYQLFKWSLMIMRKFVIQRKRHRFSFMTGFHSLHPQIRKNFLSNVIVVFSCCCCVIQFLFQISDLIKFYENSFTEMKILNKHRCAMLGTFIKKASICKIFIWRKKLFTKHRMQAMYRIIKIDSYFQIRIQIEIQMATTSMHTRPFRISMEGAYKYNTETILAKTLILIRYVFSVWFPHTRIQTNYFLHWTVHVFYLHKMHRKKFCHLVTPNTFLQK